MAKRKVNPGHMRDLEPGDIALVRCTFQPTMRMHCDAWIGRIVAVTDDGYKDLSEPFGVGFEDMTLIERVRDNRGQAPESGGDVDPLKGER